MSKCDPDLAVKQAPDQKHCFTCSSC